MARFSLGPMWFLHLNYMIICWVKTLLDLRVAHVIARLPGMPMPGKSSIILQYLEDSFFCQYTDMLLGG